MIDVKAPFHSNGSMSMSVMNNFLNYWFHHNTRYTRITNGLDYDVKRQGNVFLCETNNNTIIG
jgi:hypothetical protein